MTGHAPVHYSELQLQEYLDGQYPIEQARQLEAHLQSCPSCSGQLLELRTLFHRIGSLPDLELDLELRPGVLASIGAQRKSPAASPPVLLAQFLTALILLVLSRTLVLQLVDFDTSVLALSYQENFLRASETLIFILNLLQEYFQALVVGIDGLIYGLPTLADGIDYWVLAAAAGVLWLVVHFSLLRPAQYGEKQNGST